MLKIIALIVAAIVVAVLVTAALMPDTFRVERSALIQAPPQRIFEQINDFQRWRAWSPYEKLDPAMTRQIDGAAQGVGATYRWDGNDKAGAGRMEIVQARPGSNVTASTVTIQLDFSRPMEAHNVAEFTLVPEGDATRVTWSMHGPQPYLGKLFGLVFNLDRMIGKDFEEGLANLKRISETR